MAFTFLIIGMVFMTLSLAFGLVTVLFYLSLSYKLREAIKEGVEVWSWIFMTAIFSIILSETINLWSKYL